MPAATSHALLRALGRGIRKRCPRCGRRRIFRRWFTLVERCPGCGLRFEREEGYWVGALIVNLAVTSAAFLVVLVGGMIAFWPDVPWVGLTVAAVLVNVVVPIVFYPFSKTIWMALDVALHRMDRQDHAVSGNGDSRGQVMEGDHLRPGPPP
jgi:uncharacterized protein (DUF983 family)